jgi:PAS domain S-box-containing protein/putative nucleotidyltransferase with HDIG domain
LERHSREFRFRHDRDGHCTYVSPSVQAVTGYAADDWRAHYQSYFTVHPLNGSVIACTQASRADGVRGEPCVASLRHRDGREILLEITAHPYFDADGAVAGVTGLARDVTDQAATLEEYRQALDRYRTLFLTSRDGVFIADAETGMLVDVNPAGAALVGREARELIGQPQRVLHPPGEAERYEGAFRRVAGQPQALTGSDLYVVRPDGTRIPVEIATAVFRQDGRNFVQGVFRDLSDRNQRTAALRTAVRQLAQSLHGAPIGLCVVDAAGRITRANQALERMTGTPATRLKGRAAAETVGSESLPKWQASIDDLLRGRRIHFSMRVMLNPTGVAALLHAGRLSDPDGRSNGAVLLYQDLRELEMAQAEAARQRQRAVDALSELAAALGRTIETRDPYTAGHQARVARIAAAIAQEIGLPAEQVRGIEIGAQLHDIGKIAVPSEVLTYPGPLHELHRVLVQQHPRVGADIVRGIETPWKLTEIIEQHHERLDGSGYPAGLTAEHICLEARVVAVADVVEAMTAHRPYRPARTHEAALEELRQGRGRLYDSRVVDACLRIADDIARREALLGPA